MALREPAPARDRRRRAGRRARDVRSGSAGSRTRRLRRRRREPFYAVGLWYERLRADDRRRGAAAAGRGRRRRRPHPAAPAATGADATPPTTIRAARAMPLSRRAGGLRRAPRRHRRRALRADRRGDARDARVLPRARAHHAAADRRAGLHRRGGRGRLAGRLPRQPLRARRAAPTTTRSRRSATSAASRPGCGATPTCSTSSAGCARTTTPRPADARAGFYGLDLYSLHASMEAVLGYLDKVDPEAARRARAALRVLRPVRRGPAGLRLRGRRRADARRASARSSRSSSSCSAARGRVRHAATAASRADDHFFAEQNARAGRRTPRSTTGRCSAGASSPGTCATGTWPRRSTRCSAFLERTGAGARIVVWAHNSHLGDARATEMGERGELNLGQLVRERVGRHAVARRLHARTPAP